MLKETSLTSKERANKKKASDNIIDIVKTYKKWRVKAEGSGWGTGQDEHKKYALAEWTQTNVKAPLMSKSSWFYEFESVFHKHPTINPPLIIESGELLYRDGKAVYDDGDLAFSWHDER